MDYGVDKPSGLEERLDYRHQTLTLLKYLSKYDVHSQSIVR